MSTYYCSHKERKKLNELGIWQIHTISEIANSHVCICRLKRLRYKGGKKPCFSREESESTVTSYSVDIKWLSGCSEVGNHTRRGSNSSHFTGQL